MVAAIRGCRACAERFAATATAHEPRPVLQASTTARVLLAGQAPGLRAHRSRTPFDDPSGDRLRGWMGVDRATFYDARRLAILPMAFCFPGYDARGADLPPPPICARLWRDGLLAASPRFDLELLIGRAAIGWRLPSLARRPLAEIVAGGPYPLAAGGVAMALPHPSWRTNGWRARAPWFEAETLPRLRERLGPLLDPS